MKTFSNWKAIISLLACVVSIYFALPNFTKSKYLPNLSLNLGLDLRGGSQLLLEIDRDSFMHDHLELLTDAVRSELRKNKIGYTGLESNFKNNSISFMLRKEEDLKKAISAVKNNVLNFDFRENNGRLEFTLTEDYIKDTNQKLIDQSIEIIRRRVDETGTKEPSIQRQGDNYILLQVPGLEDPGHLKQMLGRTAKLSFQMIDETILPEQAARGIVGANNVSLPLEVGDRTMYYAVNKKIDLSGDMLTSAQATIIESNKAAVSITFNNLGAKKFADLTTANTNRLLSIILDGKIISAARINEPILGGASIISGNFSIESANELALLLRAGSLPAPLTVVEERTVGPSLGQDSIEKGKVAALASLVFVMFFMVVIYGIFGIFANIALIINLVMIAALLTILQATLTMPGIAGIILTMGMAVDANVLIFERIREELKNCMSMQAAVSRGFSHAFTTILDSNITTIIVAIFLYTFGSGVVKGFAVTLTIGILTSMFSAITLTKMMIDLYVACLGSEKQKKLKFV